MSFVRWLPWAAAGAITTGVAMVVNRLRCAVVGHEWTETEIIVTDAYYPATPADGYRCDRCGSESNTLPPWSDEPDE